MHDTSPRAGAVGSLFEHENVSCTRSLELGKSRLTVHFDGAEHLLVEP